MSEPTPEQEASGGPRSSWQDLPLDAQIAAWETRLPGSAERMLRQIEADYEHRRWLDKVEIRFRIFGAVVAGTGITGLFWLAKYLVDHHAPGVAAGIFGAGIAAFAGLVFRRDRQGK
ncbi:hypothetical protein ABZT17_29930 [Streptomyces sp. NPDC005648]|uniref:hypothetical protein n=1 Tax=Streptomyces sp. NPDC005648 TaxID=3157044 RepID=UPI0033AA4F51